MRTGDLRGGESTVLSELWILVLYHSRIDIVDKHSKTVWRHTDSLYSLVLYLSLPSLSSLLLLHLSPFRVQAFPSSRSYAPSTQHQVKDETTATVRAEQCHTAHSLLLKQPREHKTVKQIRQSRLYFAVP